MEWIDSLTTTQLVLFAFAVVGSLLFVIQLIMMMMGGADGDADASGADADASGADADASGADADASDADGGDGHPAHADSDAAFKLFSVQGTVAFFMMLGWVGLAVNRSAGLGGPASIAIGVGAGIAANLIMAKAFQSFKNLQTSGTMDLRNAVGEEGEVYLGIKPTEPGQIQVAVQGHLKVFDAVTDDGSAVATGTRVVVVRVVKGNTMVVKKV